MDQEEEMKGDKGDDAVGGKDENGEGGKRGRGSEEENEGRG